MTGRVELLGRIAVHGTGGASGPPLPGRRAEFVLAYLVAERHRVVTQDELADALWRETLPDSWSAALRTVISEVRRFLHEAGFDPADVLSTGRRGYRLQLPTDVAVDLDEARDGLAQARALLDEGDWSAAATLGARSAELARLPFLPSHDSQWVDGIRRELDSIHARALEVAARAHHAAGDLTAAAAAAEQLVRAEPFREADHQLRIRILGEAGDRAGAMKAYEHCRTVLAEELGVEPSAATEATLQEAMQAATARPRASASSTPAGPATAAGPSPLGDLSVLVTEDHDFQRRTAVRLLRGLGVGDVSEAADGTAALELLADAAPPDVIICDIDMPEMDGVEFIRRVGERGLASAVVIASGLDSRVLEAVKSIGEAHGLQVLGALEKPLKARRLAELLGTYRRQPVRLPQGADIGVTTEEVVAALAEGQITTVFEPTVDLGECRVSAAEAVGRWTHPTEGSIPSDVFLPVLAAQGLLPRLTYAMIEGSCIAVRHCRDAGLRIGIGLDVGSAALGDVTLADRFLDKVRGGGAEPSEITCEVTEQALSAAPPVALDVMTRLRVKGFGLALDHFGARRTSPDRVARFPFTQVKLDKSLVTGAAGEPQRRDVLEETLGAATSLRIPAVATGCESDADFDLLVQLGCRYIQGSYIGEAMTAEELVERASTWVPPGSDETGP